MEYTPSRSKMHKKSWFSFVNFIFFGRENETENYHSLEQSIAGWCETAKKLYLYFMTVPIMLNFKKSIWVPYVYRICARQFVQNLRKVHPGERPLHL